MNNKLTLAPELEVTDWLNRDAPLKLSELRGKVVVLHAFQMLCPGCVIHGIPQATLIHELYNNNEVQVIGLHSVFEHHAVMNKDALSVFVNEYRLQFPIAIDKPTTGKDIPVTMEKYQLRGTPSLVLIDQDGNIRLNHFGRLNDMQVGNYIGRLLSTGSNINDINRNNSSKGGPEIGKYDTNGCII